MYTILSGTWRIGLFSLPRWVQPFIVPSTSPIQSVSLAHYPPIQPTSLVQATLPILPPPTSSVPFVEPTRLVQPIVVESALLPVQSKSSVVKHALSIQTVESGFPALPLVEPVPFDSSVPVPCTKSPQPATTEPNPPTLSIIQEALEMQVLTEQNVEEKEAVYNQESLGSVMEDFTTNETSLSGAFKTSLTIFSLSSTEFLLSFSPFLLNILLLLAMLFVGLLHTSRVVRCSVHIIRFAGIGEG